jgi:hypothetical protein
MKILLSESQLKKIINEQYYNNQSFNSQPEVYGNDVKYDGPYFNNNGKLTRITNSNNKLWTNQTVQVVWYFQNLGKKPIVIESVKSRESSFGPNVPISNIIFSQFPILQNKWGNFGFTLTTTKSTNKEHEKELVYGGNLNVDLKFATESTPKNFRCMLEIPMMKNGMYPHKNLDEIKFIGSHDIAQIAEFAASILIPPPGGLVVAAAIGAYDSYNYFKEGNNKMGGLTLLLAALPGITSLVGKIPGVQTLGNRGMSILSNKIAKGITTFLPEESSVLNYLKTNFPTIEKEYEVFVKNTADSLAKTTGKNVVSTTANTVAQKGFDAAYELGSRGLQRSVAKGAANVGSNFLKTQSKIINRGLDNMADQTLQRQLPKFSN